MIRFLIIIFLFFFSQQRISRKVPWNESRKITWNDFQAETPSTPGGSASLSCDLRFYKRMQGDSILIDVVAEMFPKVSWVKKEYKFTVNEILNHEQRHFDIKEIYAKRIRKAIFSNMHKIKEIHDVSSIIKSDIMFTRRFEIDYELQTDYGRDLKKQAEWDKKIDSILNDLNEFTDTLIIIKIKNKKEYYKSTPKR